MSSAVPEGWSLKPVGEMITESRIALAQDNSSKRLAVRLNLNGIGKRSERATDQVGATKYFSRRAGQFVYGKQNLHKGAFGIIPYNFDGFSSSQDIPTFDFNVNVHPYWFNQYFQQKDFYEGLEKIASGTGSKRIQPKDLYLEVLPTPPLPEQKKIASILTSVDEVIENTQKQIDKLQDLKKATMNELLTKGIGHTEFKDSELGRIPKSWEIRFLDDVTKRGSGHTPAKQNPSYWNGGIKWVSLADSSRLDKGFIYETDKEISKDGLANSSAVLHPKGTVVLSRDAGVGKSSVLAEEMAVSQHFMAWRCENLTDSWFLYYWMQKAKPIFEAVAIGSTIKTIGLGYFKQLKMAYPPFEEQKSIATKLLSIDEHIGKLKDKLSQTQSLKKSLMQDLLTGKVRVSVN